MVMKTVTIAKLKARLSEYLRGVRRGRPLTVLHRDIPVARIVPIHAGGGTLTIRMPSSKRSRPADVPLPPPLEADVDVLDLLQEERQGER
jgi:prevent-host-death family protein